MHLDDLNEFKEKIKSELSSVGETVDTNGEKKEYLGQSRRMILRIKSVLSPRGRNLNLKSATYKVNLLLLRKSVTPFYHRITVNGRGGGGGV